ncbi:MAG: hypothetical protein BMS9Abin02_0347 [Anaerolineae bacterium]|nr:MAG: hypothetical protein BMS9Abin02_0347 [Anaerolineae bacterium]
MGTAINIVRGARGRVRWVRGHAGGVENERADQLFVIAARGVDLAVDKAYESGETQIKPASLF